MLKNSRQEAFAHGLARDQTCRVAYIEAGYKDNYKNANRLKLHDGVKARVVELKNLVQNMRAQVSHDIVLTKAWVIEQLIGVVLDARAQEKPDSAGANKALNLLGLELGMYVERKEVGKPGEFDGLTIADKRERLLGMAADLGLWHTGHDGRRRFGNYLAMPEPVQQPTGVEPV
jgi:phage terminase small subunit